MNQHPLATAARANQHRADLLADAAHARALRRARPARRRTLTWSWTWAGHWARRPRPANPAPAQRPLTATTS